jgi:hypothetical protein
MDLATKQTIAEYAKDCRDWRHREETRNAKAVPWYTEAFAINKRWARGIANDDVPDDIMWQRTENPDAWPYRYHYPHVSKDDPSKLAYTPSERFGLEDRQLRTKPGRYLTKFYGDVLSPQEIAYWAGQFAGANESNEVKFAESGEEIERIYTNGPRSCMSHPLDPGGEGHPVRVYAAGDLAVAYLSHTPPDGEERITARCLVWPDKKQRSYRCYGDESRLKPALDALGFESGDSNLIGARLLKVSIGGGAYLGPYIDGDYRAEVESDCLRLCRNGELSCGATDGVMGGAMCERCEGHFTPDDMCSVGGELWCDDCSCENTFTCEKCEERTIDDEHVNVNDASWCNDCASSYAFQCDKCGDYHEKSGRYVGDQENTVDSNESWCNACVERHANVCERCDELVSNIQSASDELMCADCVEEHADDCHDCGEPTLNEELKEASDGELRCSDCHDGHKDDDDNRRIVEREPRSEPVEFVGVTFLSEPERTMVPAQVAGGLAVHRRWSHNGSVMERGWNVTHVRSGLGAACGLATRRDAMRVMAALNAGYDWSSFTQEDVVNDGDLRVKLGTMVNVALDGVRRV